MIKYNKKGVAPIQFILAAALLIVIIIAFTGGGIVTVFKIFKFVSQVPAWVWVILIIAFLFSGGKKRRR